MLRKPLALAAAVLISCLAVGAASAAPKAAPAKSAPAKPATAPAAARPLADTTPFDARDPANLVTLLNATGAKAQVANKDADTILVTVTSTAANFSMQFADCDPHGRGCKAVLFDNLADKAGPTFAQVNGFNQTSALCRAYEDSAGRPHVLYSALLFEGDTKDHLRTQFLAWTGCIGDFRNFLKDPNGYLASAP